MNVPNLLFKSSFIYRWKIKHSWNLHITYFSTCRDDFWILLGTQAYWPFLMIGIIRRLELLQISSMNMELGHVFLPCSMCFCCNSNSLIGCNSPKCYVGVLTLWLGSQPEHDRVRDFKSVCWSISLGNWLMVYFGLIDGPVSFIGCQRGKNRRATEQTTNMLRFVRKWGNHINQGESWWNRTWLDSATVARKLVEIV